MTRNQITNFRNSAGQCSPAALRWQWCFGAFFAARRLCVDRNRILCRERGPAVHTILRQKIERLGHQTLDLPFERTSSSWTTRPAILGSLRFQLILPASSVEGVVTQLGSCQQPDFSQRDEQGDD
jgi:hypothetical protein